MSKKTKQESCRREGHIRTCGRAPEARTRWRVFNSRSSCYCCCTTEYSYPQHRRVCKRISDKEEPIHAWTDILLSSIIAVQKTTRIAKLPSIRVVNSVYKNLAWVEVAIPPAAVRVKIIYPTAGWITPYWPGKENKYDHDVSWHTVASEWDLTSFTIKSKVHQNPKYTMPSKYQTDKYPTHQYNSTF